jgi:hypothetical protein
MPGSDAFPPVFDRLRMILKSHESSLIVRADTPAQYVLDPPPSSRYPQYPDGVFVGSVEIRQRYVSFHLMPVYAFPELLDGISDQLRRRMQGKSCFNVSAVNEDLFAELNDLTARDRTVHARTRC